MKIIVLVFALLVLCLYSNGQNNDLPKTDEGITSVNLEEVVVRNSKPDKFTSSIRRSTNVTHIFPPSNDYRDDSTMHVTKFPKIEDLPVFLYTAELQLRPFDTALLDIKLIVFQITGKDTLFRLVNINAAGIKKNKIKIDLLAEGITLQPVEFYLGYRFKAKHISEPYRYRMISTNKGESAMLIMKNGEIKIITHDNMHYVFPFKLSYKKLD